MLQLAPFLASQNTVINANDEKKPNYEDTKMTLWIWNTVVITLATIIGVGVIWLVKPRIDQIMRKQ